ncbi:hypothetical protein HO133_002312 [Letharia lupina]|uniref:Uncharacterized protein n=1 Tax=Letharia lupina TaxID=560253 RepID=A0A8H6CE02_9LECA|nr:uncharacterized protein HO133_002312 [Letharia lupina]KAF6221456.1 hypothetical protein HO133_002312 [Letharia lupina]
MDTNPITRRYGPEPQKPKNSGTLLNQTRARLERAQSLFHVGSSVWEIWVGGRQERRVVSDCTWDEGQGYVVMEESAMKDLGWLEEYSLTSDGP